MTNRFGNWLMAGGALLLTFLLMGQGAFFPQTLPGQTVVGRLTTSAGPAEAIPLATLNSQLSGLQSANTVFAGPTSGAQAFAAFRALVNADTSGITQVGNLTIGSVAATLAIASGKTLTASNTLTFTGTDGKAINFANSLNFAGTDSTTVTFQATDTYVGRATTDTLTNKTIDTAGPNTLKVGGVTLSGGQYPGTATNDNATTGNIGQYISSNVLVGSALSLSTGTPLNVTSVSLTAGDWDCQGVVSFSTGTTTTLTVNIGAINTTSATLPTIGGTGYASVVHSGGANGSGATSGDSLNIAPTRLSLSGTTTTYLVAQSAFGTSTNAAYGFIGCRRAR